MLLWVLEYLRILPEEGRSKGEGLRGLSDWGGGSCLAWDRGCPEFFVRMFVEQEIRGDFDDQKWSSRYA